MDNPLFLITKGLKAKKKRLGGGGGGGATPTKTTISAANFNPARTQSSSDVTIIDMATGNPISGFNRAAVDDLVATNSSFQNGANDVGTIDGEATLTISGSQYMINFDQSMAQAANFSGTETATLTVIHDPNNLVSSNVVTVRTGSVTAKSGFIFFTTLDLAIDGTIGGSAGNSFIVQVEYTGGTSSSATEISNGTATSKDAFYFRVTFS
tara:strand:- start:445 stop:1074 length:630 start_codon:yes stop_codon:yes gene_type:complete